MVRRWYDKLGPQLVDGLEKLKEAGAYEISSPHYKRVPRGYEADHPRAELLRQKALYVSSPTIKKAVLTKPDFTDLCLDHIAQMIPLHH